MKMNLFTKFLCIYLLVAVLGFAGVSFLIYKIDYNSVYKKETDNMYRQAVSIAGEFAPNYFSNERLRAIQIELKTISKLNESRIMFIDMSGNVILDTGYKGNLNDEGILYRIPNFNLDNMGAAHSTIGYFYDLFDEKTVSSYAPIANKFVMKGYVVVHLPESTISDRVNLTFNTNYYTLLMMLILSFAFVIIYVINIHNPINELSKAINEYGKGNLAYRISSKHNAGDEIAKLAISLEYMATKLSEIDESQQKFLSNISHDFRSPLTSIKGYLEAISDGTIPPEMTQKYIDIVLFETERLTKLTSNILTLNDLDPKAVRLEPVNFDINSIIKHTIETFEGTCKKRKIQFQLTFSGETAMVYADKEKIQQVIYNLIDNAIKFSSENSAILINVKEKSGKIYTSVKDNGCGIPKETLDKIWDRFYKSDTSRGRDKKGSGLGLSITKEIIQAHNENIDVISTTDVGTEFIFTLPLAKN